jgi:hypothetical protein
MIPTRRETACARNCIQRFLENSSPASFYNDVDAKEAELADAEVRAQWRQARYTWHRDGCTVETGYFDYQEDARPVSIEILK